MEVGNNVRVDLLEKLFRRKRELENIDVLDLTSDNIREYNRILEQLLLLL